MLRSLSSLTSLYTMVMDVHERFRTESHTQAAARFNERFLLSIASCKACVVMDDELNILPISSHMKFIQPVTNNEFAVSCAAENCRDVVFICSKGRMENNPPFWSQGVDPSVSLLQRIQIKYVEDGDQQHVLNQLLQEVKKNNNRSFAQQPPPDAPNASSGRTSGPATPNVAASGEQAQHISNNNNNYNSTVKSAAPAGTGPSNVINNNTFCIVHSRNNSFKSVSSNPAVAATGGNAANSKVDDSFQELGDLDHLIANELVVSGLFVQVRTVTHYRGNVALL